MIPGRLLRTVRHLRARQIWAQATHLVRRPGPPRPAAGPPPPLRSPRAQTAFLPAPDHARWDGGRRVELIGRSVAFRDAIDWDFSGEGPLWAYHLHQFDFARRPGVSARARTDLLLDWIEGHGRGTGWSPHPTSLRILSWGRLLLTPGALLPGEDEPIRLSLSAQVDHLAARPEVRLQANHLFSNWLGVVFGSFLLDRGADPVGMRGWRALRTEIARQIGADGLHEERSPMYHALLLESLLDLLNLAMAATTHPAAGEVVAEVGEAAARMLGALEVLTHPDGEIALFADSAFGIAHPPARLADYARRLGVEPRPPSPSGVLSQGGYVRLEAPGHPTTLLASVAGPAPAHQPGHAHCDFLGFELSWGDERVVTDAGVAEYIPGSLRDACRSVRAHATIEVAGREPAELWGAHRVGGRPRVELVEASPGRHAEALCAGWSTPDTVHRRRFELEPGRVRIRDRIEGTPRPLTLRLPLAPGVRVELREGRARLRLASGRELRVSLPEGPRWRVERGFAFPRFGSRVERAVIVGEATEGVAGEQAPGEWVFEGASR